MAASTQRTVRTPDGRTLAIEEAGDPGGRPVLVHNGTPNSRHLYGPAAAAAARGLRLIGYDRPGYGGSTPQPGRTVADCAADVRAICAGLGIDRLAMWGVSGGGPHVLACAAPLTTWAARTVQSVAGGAEHNFAPMPEAWLDPTVLPAEAHGLSAFAREDGTVYHTYSAYARGGDATWAMWQWLDRAPLGRNEGDMSWFHRHDEYPA